MSIHVACQCGQAFSAPEELAGQTLPCPMCQRPIAIAAPFVPVAPPVAAAGQLGGNSPFQTMPAAVAPRPQPPHLVRGEEDSPLVVWLSAIGGGLALVLVIGLLIYNATRRPTTQVATTPTVAAAPSLPAAPAADTAPQAAKDQSAIAPSAITPTPASPMATSPASTAPPQEPAQPVAAATTAVPPATASAPMPPAAELPVAPTIPVAAQLPAAAPPRATAEPAAEAAPFTPPEYGGMIATEDGKYEVWLPSAPQKFDAALDQAAFLPKPKAGKALIAFGKQGPTEMCAVSITPGATAAEMYAEMERSFPGEPETRSIKFAGVDARQYDFFIEITEGKFAIRTVAFVLDGNGYTLQTLSITGQKETDETRAFFASFRKKQEKK